MQLDEIKNKIIWLNVLVSELEKEPNSFEDMVFKKYIELESLPKLVKLLSEKEVRTDRGTVYKNNELSAIIQSAPKNVHSYISEFAHNIFKKNKKRVSTLYW